MYEKGRGVIKDEREAVKWYRKVAAQGHGWGQYLVGRCYLYGVGVPKNKSTAKSWLEKAYKNTDDSAKDAAAELWAESKK
jgi:TPR repeat protein